MGRAIPRAGIGAMLEDPLEEGVFTAQPLADFDLKVPMVMVSMGLMVVIGLLLDGELGVSIIPDELRQ